MKEITLYEANDGMRFEDEGECLEHEFTINEASKFKHCVAFSETFEIIDFDHRLFDNELIDLTYIYIGDEVGFDAFNKLNDDMGYVAPSATVEFHGPMFLMYDNDRDEWKDIEDVIHGYQNIIETMKEYIK